MSDLQKHQSCPYCGEEVDDCQAEWEEGQTSVECDSCKEYYTVAPIYKYYTVAPIYKFLGFEIKKNCEGCGEIEEDCCCDLEDEEVSA